MSKASSKCWNNVICSRGKIIFNKNTQDMKSILISSWYYRLLNYMTVGLMCENTVNGADGSVAICSVSLEMLKIFFLIMLLNLFASTVASAFQRMYLIRISRFFVFFSASSPLLICRPLSVFIFDGFLTLVFCFFYVLFFQIML